MGGGGGGNNDAEEAEKARQARIAKGTADVNRIFEQYTPDFYSKRATDYEGWAMPQVEDQYKKAQEQLLYALARQYGSTNTSEAAARQAELAKQYGIAKTGQTEQGLNLANQARSNVENARTEILQQLAATADPAAAATSAMNQQDILTRTDPYTPLGELFANVTEGLAASQYPYGIFGQQPTPIAKAGVSTGMGKKPVYTVT
jgi:hypothetical protein